MKLAILLLDIVIFSALVAGVAYLLRERDQLADANYILPKSTWICAASSQVPSPPNEPAEANTQYYNCVSYVRNPD